MPIEEHDRPAVSGGAAEPGRADVMLSALATLWESRRVNGRLPLRSDFPVSALRPWLGHLALFEFRPEAGYVFRLCGTRLRTRFGGEMNGKPISELGADGGQSLRQMLKSVIAARRPARARHISGPLSFDDLYLPLAEAGGTLILFASYRSREEQAPQIASH